jgi:hypothetical protein
MQEACAILYCHLWPVCPLPYYTAICGLSALYHIIVSSVACLPSTILYCHLWPVCLLPYYTAICGLSALYHIILSSVACLPSTILYCHLWPVCPLPYFSALSNKWDNFRDNFIEHKIRFWISLQHLSKTFLILRRTERDIIINAHRSSHKVPDIPVTF